MADYVLGAPDSPFTAGLIETPLRGVDVVSVPLDADPAAVVSGLEKGEFDQAPVAQGGRMVGWVRTSDLRGAGSVGTVMTPLSETRIVASSAPISQVLRILGEGFVFTVHGEGLSGFITPSDLEKHAARAHFYLLIAEVEMQLSHLVHHHAPEAAIIAKIEARTESRGRWRTARQASSDSRPVEYLYLSDLKRLFLSHVDKLPNHASRKTLDDLLDLRNEVMHPTKPMLGKRGANELAQLDVAIHSLRDHLSQLMAVSASPGDALSAVPAKIQP